jgi:hypothetical protein
LVGLQGLHWSLFLDIATSHNIDYGEHDDPRAI